jgi:hypothetical protein
MQIHLHEVNILQIHSARPEIRFYYIHFVAYNIRKLWLNNTHYLTIALIFDDIQTNCNDCVQLRLTYFELIVWICLILLIKYTCFCFPVTVCSSCIYIIRSTRVRYNNTFCLSFRFQDLTWCICLILPNDVI